MAPGAGPWLRTRDTPMSGNSLGGPGQVSSQVQPGLGVQVEGRRSRPTSRLAQPPPHIQQSESGPGPSGPLCDMATGQAGALCPRRRRQGPGDPLGSRCQFGTESQRLSPCKVVTHRPLVTRCDLLDGASAGLPPPPCFWLSLWLIQQVQGPAEPALASSARKEPLGLWFSPSRVPGGPAAHSRGTGAPSVPSLQSPLTSARTGGPPDH